MATLSFASFICASVACICGGASILARGAEELHVQTRALFTTHTCPSFRLLLLLSHSLRLHLSSSSLPPLVVRNGGRRGTERETERDGEREGGCAYLIRRAGGVKSRVAICCTGCSVFRAYLQGERDEKAICACVRSRSTRRGPTAHVLQYVCVMTMVVVWYMRRSAESS